jgi:flavin reductase (DIM6/NTAB) family NADH-FMN oxidoreductase RutF
MTIQLPAVRDSAPAVADCAPAVTGAEFRQFMRSWPCGVAVVTARAGPDPAGCTVSALLSVSLSPPTLLISLAQTSATLAAITAQRAFGINVLTWRQRHLAQWFATSRDDRFAGVPYRLERDVPILDDAAAAAVCSLDQVIMAADHVLLLGAPQWCGDVSGADPVIFAGGACRSLFPHPAA